MHIFEAAASGTVVAGGVAGIVATIRIVVSHVVELMAYRAHLRFVRDMVKELKGTKGLDHVAQLVSVGPSVGPRTGHRGFNAQSADTGDPTGDGPTPGPDDADTSPQLRRVR